MNQTFSGRNEMLKKLMLIAVLSGVAAAAHADDRWQVKETIQLRDGTTLYVFQDGKMGMQNRWGRAVSMTPATRWKLSMAGRSPWLATRFRASNTSMVPRAPVKRTGRRRSTNGPLRGPFPS